LVAHHRLDAAWGPRPADLPAGGTSGGGPGGGNNCFDLLQAIIDLLNEVARRFNDAVDDLHDLYRYHREISA
jgi:hypothetical protein